MSYFPTDIPFMSDEEMRENGIRIPGDVSDTNVGNIEYIRKQDAVDEINANADGLEQNGGIPYAQGARAMAIVVEQIPPADVAPVEYGEWISVPEMWGAFDVRYHCSKCGKDAIINNSERYVLSDYCPHCGAIMDNKRGSENG